MNVKLRYLFEDKTLKFSTILALLVIAACSALVVFYQSKLPPYVPFFNSFPWGVERLVSSKGVMLIPGVLIIVYVINTLLSVWIYNAHALLARILSFNTLLLIILGFLAYLQILFLVF